MPKLADLRRFRRAVAGYRILPDKAIGPSSVALPVLESALAVSLLVGSGSQIVPALADVLLVLFAVAISINVIRESGIECGCGGWDRPVQVGWSPVIRNLALATLATVLVAEHPASSAALLREHRVTVSDILALAVASGLALVAIAVVRATTDLFRASRKATRLLRIEAS